MFIQGGSRSRNKNAIYSIESFMSIYKFNMHIRYRDSIQTNPRPADQESRALTHKDNRIKSPRKKIPLNAVERLSVETRVLNPNASEASYKPKQRSYRKTKLRFFFFLGDFIREPTQATAAG